MGQLFIKLNNHIYAESGYSWEPVKLSKDTDAMFCTIGAHGKPVQFENIPGCGDGLGEKFVSVFLTQYKNAEVANLCIKAMSENLLDALDGDTDACTTLAVAWVYLLLDGVGVDALPMEKQFAVLKDIMPIRYAITSDNAEALRRHVREALAA